MNKNINKTNTIALVLAGGKGNRLGRLSENNAKPSLPFGGGRKIIDYTLLNLQRSGIDNVNVMLQYQADTLKGYLKTNVWGFNHLNTLIGVEGTDKSYSGTADAIYDNIEVIDDYHPENVLILNADHIYEMDYQDIIQRHERCQADFTIGYTEVPSEDTYRYGILKTDSTGKVTDYQEKPEYTDSCKASMGLYVVKWQLLKQYLIDDANNDGSKHDLGHNIVPKILNDGHIIYAHAFTGYWQDVGTVNSYWSSNLDMLNDTYHHLSGSYHDDNKQSIISHNVDIKGTVHRSVVHHNVVTGYDSYIDHSVIHPSVIIYDDVHLSHVIVSEDVRIPEGTVIKGHTDNIIVVDTEYIRKQVV